MQDLKTNLIGTSVKVERLSTYITEVVSFVKIDTEGSEADILKDLVREDKHLKIEQVAIEFHRSKNRVSTEQFIAQLSTRNFTLVAHYESGQDDLLKFVNKFLKL